MMNKISTCTFLSIKTKFLLGFLAIFFFFLTACGGGNSGQAVQQNPNTTVVDQAEGIIYKGPAEAATSDVKNFEVEVWQKLASSERCGACHVEGGQEPQFVRGDDINLAYAAANTIVDLSAPSSSRMVVKVGEGHNCWRPENSVCAETVTNFISAWANESGTEANVITLQTPVLKEVGNSRSFPPTSAEFAATVYPIVSTYCSQCHSEEANVQQQPYFASGDVDIAYEAVKSKINLDDPASSRLVLRLRNQFHNCWDNCASDAATMQERIQTFADGIALTEVDENLVVSRALALPDGIVASSGGRIESDIVALYEFKTGSGVVAFDTSGVDPALDLNISGNVEWVGSWGLRINDGKAQGITSASAKLRRTIAASGEYSIEAWVVPDNVNQDGPAKIVTYSGGSELRNFSIGQTLYNYNFMTRSSNSDGNGMPMLSTPDADEVLQATLQHVVANFDPINGREIYVNGELVAQDLNPGGNLNEWDDTFALAIGNEIDNQDLWQGTIRFLAIHSRKLSPEDIKTNFDVGVGQKFFLLFSVAHLIDMPESYVVFEVQQYDNYSYLFNTPFFISLDTTAVPQSDIVIEGIRIGINGREASVGQSYANVNITINNANYNSAEGVPLSALGAVIALEKGADSDEFFLTFDRIGNESYQRVEADAPSTSVPVDLDEQSDIGLRLFGEINASLAAVTGISETEPSVASVFQAVQQQLPTAENIDGFLAAHQAGVMQLAVAYCTAVVGADQANLGSPTYDFYFDGFDFSAAPAQAFSPVGRDQIISPLLNGLVANTIDLGDSGTATLSTQPAAGAMAAELNNLIDRMSAADTQTTVIAVCASALGSAVMLLQ